MSRSFANTMFLLATFGLSIGLSGCGGSDQEQPAAPVAESPDVTPATDEVESGGEKPSEEVLGDDASSDVPSDGGENTPIVTETVVTALSGSSIVDLSYLTENQYIAIIAHPKRLLESKFGDSLKENETAGMLLSEASPVPAPLRSASRILVLLGNPVDHSPPEDLTIVISFSEPVDQDEIGFALTNSTEEEKVDGKYVGSSGPVAFFHDEQTAVMYDSSRQEVQPAKTPAKTDLAAALAALTEADLDKDIVLVASVDAARPMLQQQIDAGGVPPMAAGFVSSINDAATARIALDMSGDSLLEIKLRGVDEPGAQRLESMLRGILAMGQGLLANQQADIPPEQQAGLQLANSAMQSIAINRGGQDVSFTLKRPEGLNEFLQGLPEMIMGGFEPGSAAADASNNMKQIALAMHNYHDAFGRFPGVVSRGKDGKTLLSWRVAILPFLEEKELADEFKLDEPWDSENNEPLTLEMPFLFGDSEFSSPENSNKAIFVGEGTPFTVKGEGPKMADITDGTSNTIMFIEVPTEKATVWTKPQAIGFKPGDPLKSLGEFPDGEVRVAFFDGSVRTLPADLPADVWRRLIQHQDGEAVNLDELPEE